MPQPLLLQHALQREVFPRVQKAGRYIGREVNTIVKEPSKVRVRFALCFPEVYEFGMSSTGLAVLYEALNRLDGVQCERVFAPYLDMEEEMRRRRLPLYGLETFTPLSHFDIVGFSLAYELNATNVLQMLELGGIPLLCSERDGQHPIVVAGGHAVFNPEPYTDFIDAFCIGEGEELVVDLCQFAERTRGLPRRRRLEKLAEIEGVYVPALYETETLEDGTLVVKGAGESVRIRRRIVSDLNTAPFPLAPILAWVKPVHDRATVEVFRGCTRGCRFCQAGMITRPVRERSVELLRWQAVEQVKLGGHDNVGLLSLSTCDYSRIEGLVAGIFYDLRLKHVSISMPSSRIDGFTTDLAHLIQEGKRSGLTFAPEAGTERLRNVINKPISDEEILAKMTEVFSLGWDKVKLYFMVGLPTETDEDVVGIINLAKEILRHGWEVNPKASVTVSVSNFIPKPHTPFQWDAQMSLEETKHKQALLRKQTKFRNLHLKYHDERVSLLEGVFSRGDRRLNSVLLEAYRLGCRLDGWDEYLKWDEWMESFKATSIKPHFYLRALPYEHPLPWEHIDCLVTKQFLQRERLRAESAETTPDCRWQKCSLCGAVYEFPKVCQGIIQIHRQAKKPKQVGAKGQTCRPTPTAITHHFSPPPQGWRQTVPSHLTGEGDGEAERRYEQLHQPPPLQPQQRIRFRYTKLGMTRFLSQLELCDVIIRALRRAQIPLAYSHGFRPQPKISFGSALGVGLESEAEYGDVWLEEWMHPDEFTCRLNSVLPEGVRVIEACSVALHADNVMEHIALSAYRVNVPKALVEGDPHSHIGRALSSESLIVERRAKESGKGKEKEKEKVKTINLRSLIHQINLVSEDGEFLSLEMLLSDAPGQKARPQEVVQAVFGLEADALLHLRILKLASICQMDGRILSPMECK